jgi:hypothetical protein
VVVVVGWTDQLLKDVQPKSENEKRNEKRNEKGCESVWISINIVEVLKNSLFCDLEIPSCEEEKEKEEERKTKNGQRGTENEEGE